ncbi:GGDEF domain-containing protein [Acetobacter sp. TBRC 12305]|uniref:diguanylate cyclase n=1 Tax=Acetobacter garciniae TaxID=2817435 RepID=A0A939HMY5_9PROT|nr:GGDEF domain-containing protein [Acetobacter garciniae]MBO1324618.1 GGDEF domain-containing protein [Acetobacter garciniae]MBX0344307.1 GGDEF domain-containing protein [Acetobacter garciniae]
MRKNLYFYIKAVFSASPEDIEHLCLLQKRMGSAYARLEIPAHLIAYGFFIIKRQITSLFLADKSDQFDTSSVIIYIGSMMDFSFKFVMRAYDSRFRKAVESKEVLRMVSLGQDLAFERETQVRTFFAWSTQTLTLLCENRAQEIQLVEDSDFGLWFTHKGRNMFKGTREFDTIQKEIEKIDSDIALVQNTGEVPKKFSEKVYRSIRKINFLAENSFHQIEKVESGKDPLTKVLNRRFLDAVMQNEISYSMTKEKKFCIILFDIDHFKSINDKYGHLVGDDVLCFVANTLVALLRVNDYIFRYGGEEFLIILTEMTPQEAQKCAERLRASMEKKPLLLSSGETISVTLSGGLTFFDGKTNAKVLINQADQALYKAKRQGRNRIITSVPSDGTTVVIGEPDLP